MKTKRRKQAGHLCLLLQLAVWAAFFSETLRAQNAPASAVASTEADMYGGALPVAPGDLVQVDVFESPDLSGRYRVSQTGDVNLTLVGSFHISGLSAGDAAHQIEKLLLDKRVIKQPHVNVFVREYASPGVTILGEVRTPGLYPALGQHRLYDLIAAAGGFTAAASNRVTILHSGIGGSKQFELSNMALTDEADDVPLLPGDRVVVDTGGIVYVMGDVGRAGGFVLSRADTRLTVLKALALAGGINHTAKLQAATVITETDAGLSHQDIDLKRLLRHEIADITLQPGQVLYLPPSTAKIIGYRSLEAVFVAASQAAVLVGVR